MSDAASDWPAGTGAPHLIALMTSHDRKPLTLACLESLRVAADRARVRLTAVLVDDGSSDGTAEAVARRYAWVRVERGDGSLFWNRGMHRAQAIATASPADALLWVNDDTLLAEDALTRLLRTAETLRPQHGDTIVVGATADRATGAITYSGQVAASRLRRFNYRKVWSADIPLECEVMNGNLVLIPGAVARRVGNLDPAYEHALGDLDYALRARRAGFRVFVAPGIAGSCSNNPVAGTFLDRTLPLRARWRKMLSRKGLPVRSWWHFTTRHGGLLAPLYFVWPYARVLAESCTARLSGRAGGRRA